MPTPDLTIGLSADRSSLGLAALDLNDGVGYVAVSFGPGTRVRRNVYNRSGNVHGVTLISSVLDIIVRPLVVRVYGSTMAQLQSRTLDLIETVEQASWQITESIDGQDTTYNCLCAESISPADSTGGAREDWDKYQLMASPYRHVYRIAVPTQPQPTVGPI